jgi:two-component system, LytTR family, sensor histidine kinase AlgZ
MTGVATTPVAQESRAWALTYWFLQVLGWGGYVAIGLSTVLPQAGPQPVILVGFGSFFFYSIALSHALRRLIRRREWLALAPGPAALRLFAAAVGLGTVLALLIVTVQSLWNWTSPLAMGLAFVLSMWVSTTSASLVWTALYTAGAALLRSRRARQNAIALELDMREARLRALESQIAPHFLFNCLNSLRGMIAENPAQAQDMVTRLASIMRHNLLRDTSPSQTLGEQVEFTADYLALESVRFDDRLHARFAIAPETRACTIPAMLLQTLVENAIKHGIAHQLDRGEIAITSAIERGTLVVSVENTGQLTDSPAGSTRVGLANLRERLRVLHGPEARLELSETGRGTVLATVRIPGMVGK